MASIENSLKYEAEVEPGIGGARRPAEPLLSGSPGGFAPPVAGTSSHALPVRRKLPHGSPPFPVAGPIIQFVTINAARRGALPHPGAPLLCGSPGGVAPPVAEASPFLDVAEAMLDSAFFYHCRGRWFLHLFLIMPDHLHMLASFPSGRVKETCGAWKGFLKRTTGVCFQSDCFEHRIRNAEEFSEKWHYICNNPLRKGLVASANAWQYWMSFDPMTGNQIGGARRLAEPIRQSAGSPGTTRPTLSSGTFFAINHNGDTK